KYVARMTARADALIQLDQGKKGLVLKKKARLIVEPPAEWDESLAAEGLDEKPPGGVGKRAWWLQQILSAVPPSHWSGRLGFSAEDLIAALDGNDYEKDVLIAWMAAAPRSRDAAWCGALARHAVAEKKGSPVDLAGLWKNLDAAAREAVMTDILAAAKSV